VSAVYLLVELKDRTHFTCLGCDRSRCGCISQLGRWVLSASCLPDANMAFILFMECKHEVFGQFCCV